MNISEIKTSLISLGLSEEEVNKIKGKENLLKRLSEIEQEQEEDSSDILEDAIDSLIGATNEKDSIQEVESSEEIDLKEKDDDQEMEIINLEAISTQEEVMALFKEEELLDGKYPKVNGLRRVANIVIGPIVHQNVNTIELSPTIEKSIPAVMAEFTTVFYCRNNNFGPEGMEISFSDASDCIPNVNCTNDKFSKYPTAIASTRAEARVLRKALRLNVVSAEEMDIDIYEDAPLINKTGETYISEQQTLALRKKCKDKNIDLKEVLAELDREVVTEKELTTEEFTQVFKDLNFK